MATLFMDNYSIYGDLDHLTDGMYAQVVGSSNLALTTLQNETCLEKSSTDFSGAGLRYTLPAQKTTLLLGVRLYQHSLPSNNQRSFVIQFRDNTNANIATLWVSTTGQLVLSSGDANGTELGRTSGPVLTAGTWHHIEMKILRDAAAGTFTLRMDNESTNILALTGLALGASDIAQIYAGSRILTGNSLATLGWAYTDLHVWDTSGTRNTDLLGDVSISTLWPNEDVETGWTPNYRKKIEAGVLDLRGITRTGSINTGVRTADAASLELGSDNYTLEGFVRFDTLPTGSERATLMAKWYEAGNTRSWRLSKCGPSLNSGHIQFEISTGGGAGTVQTIHSYPWDPETDRWYHIAVVRDTGENLLFIDGILQNVPQTDAYTYYNGAAIATIGNEAGSTTSTRAGYAVNGWMDEVRWTRGVARYTANFTPTTVPFGRNTTDDTDFNSVILLCGFDEGFYDESSYARTLTISDSLSGGTTEVNFPDDGSYQYETINQQDSPTGAPRDDTNISASYYRAAGILTLGSLPLDTETVTINGQAYTFKATLASAYDILIDVDIQTTLQNLAAAINDSGGAGTKYGTGTVINPDVQAEEMVSPQMKVLAVVAGTAGNSLTLADTLSDGAWDGATLSGGADIPSPSSFYLTRLPIDVTTVRSVMAVTRAYKTDSGTAKMRTNFVGPAGAATLGTEQSLTVNPTFRTDVFEADPDTTGPITPSTLLTGRLRFDRTE